MVTMFNIFFLGKTRHYLERSIALALDEDGRDLTTMGLFSTKDHLRATLIAKEPATLAGLAFIPLILTNCSLDPSAPFALHMSALDGDTVPAGTILATIEGPAHTVLKSERVILNYACHLSGIATYTRRYADALLGTRTRLLDTRKTLPGLRYPEKYAVRLGNGLNHRLDLEQMLMLKDNHIDSAGGITKAVTALRAAYHCDCPPIEVECRTLPEVQEAVAAGVARIMLDNMCPAGIASALLCIPKNIESEVSGNVTLNTIREIAMLGPNFISVGHITHSAPAADMSLHVEKP
ncbi:nicotinate-nucleotide pyrophosphorylase (carboxylating) [Desulfovibrionales bacterium]